MTAALYSVDGLPDRIASKIAARENGCWEWTAATSGNGYGVVGWPKGHTASSAHRVVYELLVGEIPSGLQVDHLCRVRHCVNPDHLELVTNRENVLRGVGPSAMNARKTHCLKGHEYSAENTAIYAGSRCCRECHRIRQRHYNALRSPKRASS